MSIYLRHPAITVDRYMDAFPILSIVNNTIILIAKAIFLCMSQDRLNAHPCLQYANNKSTLLCLSLIFLPIVSNIYRTMENFKILNVQKVIHHLETGRQVTIPPEMQDIPEVVLAGNSLTLECSSRLKSDAQFALRMLRQEKFSTGCERSRIMGVLSWSLRDDKEFMDAVQTINPELRRFASGSLRLAYLAEDIENGVITSVEKISERDREESIVLRALVEKFGIDGIQLGAFGNTPISRTNTAVYVLSSPKLSQEVRQEILNTKVRDWIKFDVCEALIQQGILLKPR